MHAIRPQWLYDQYLWNDNRICRENNTVVLEMQDKTNILSTIEFYKKDLPKQVSWNEITALSDLLLGVEFLPNRTVTVKCKSDADSKQTFILPCLTKSHFSTQGIVQ